MEILAETSGKSKEEFKHLKTKSMDKISIKVHPPWYARGTPLTNTRDGPAMALNNKLLFAICREPSGEGKGRGGSQQAAVGSWQSEVRSRKSEVGRWKSEDGSCPPASPTTPVWRERKSRAGKSEDRSRGEPKGKTRRWLTLKTTFFNTQKSVYGQWYAVLGRKMGKYIEQVSQSHQLRGQVRRRWQPSPADSKFSW